MKLKAGQSKRVTTRAVVTAAICLCGLKTSSAFPADVLVHDTQQLRSALSKAGPGSRILLAAGDYEGGLYFENIKGQQGKPIVIAAADPKKPPKFRGGGECMHLSRPEYVELHDLIFAGASGNGLNIDDGGSYSDPAHHVVLRGLHVTDVGPEGNRDGIKLSGVNDFKVEGCRIERWGSGGSGIDMVGCHNGLIEGNLFRNNNPAGGSGVQAKGGSSKITIRRNRFENSGGRAINLGGSTGLEFFRPPLAGKSEHAEARELIVEGNYFVGGGAPFAFVGVDGAVVRFNTIFRPGRWVIRILQETTERGFVPSRRGEFTDNIIQFRSDNWAEGGINIGPGTAPDTFKFARNVWYCEDQPSRSHPRLPAQESGGLYGRDPLLRDPERGDLRLQAGSPAHGHGADAVDNPKGK